MVALAKGLVKKGHEIRICGPPDGLDLFDDRLGAYHAYGPNIRALLTAQAAAMDRPAQIFSMMVEQLNSGLEDQFDALAPHTPWAELLICTSLVFAGPSVAEAAQLPLRMLHYTSQFVPSRHHPPPAVPFQDLPKAVNWLAWRLQTGSAHLICRSTLNRRRQALGLSPSPSIFEASAPKGHLLVAADPLLSPLGADFDPQVTQTGALAAKSEGEVPQGVLSFIREAPTLYVGFGSMPDGDPAATTALILQACEGLKVQVLISQGWAGLGAASLPRNCLTLGNSPHDRLFPELAGVVHHGGAGTTATAAAAGVPQVAIPHLLDQFRFAARLHNLGLGPAPIRRSRLRPRPCAPSP